MASAAQWHELSQMRAKWRNSKLPPVIYQAAPAASGAEPARRAHAVRTVELALVAGLDFPPNATHWHQLQQPALDVVSTLAHAMVLLDARGKQPRARAGKAGAAPAASREAAANVTMTLETLLTEPDAPGAANTPRTVAGYKVRWHISQHRPRVRRAAANNAQGEEAAAVAEDEAAEDAGGDALQNEVLEADAGGAVPPPPVARALERHFREVAVLRADAAAARERLAKQRRGTESPLRLPVPGETLATRYARFGTMEEFFFDAVKPYLNAGVRGKAGAGSRHGDRRLCWQAVRGVADGSGATYLKPGHALHPDALFTKEAALVYHMRSVAGAQRRLDSYVPNAFARPPDGDHSAAAEADESHDDDDDDDARLIDTLLGLRLDEEAAPTLAAWMDADGQTLLYGDVLFPKWPAPGVTYHVSRDAMFPEVLLPYMPLPHAVGAVLPPAIVAGAATDVASGVTTPLWPGGPQQERELLTAIRRLQVLERAQPPPASVSLDVDGSVRMSSRRGTNVAGQIAPYAAPTPSLAAALADTATAATGAELVPAEELEATAEEQLGVVARAVALLAAEARSALYAELLKPPPLTRPASTHDTMPLEEFLSDGGLDAEQQQRAQAEQLAEQLVREFWAGEQEEPLTPAVTQAILSRVPGFSAWQVERCEFLEQRQAAKLAHGVLDFRQQRRADTLAAHHASVRSEAEAGGPAVDEAALAEEAEQLEARHRSALGAFYTQRLRATDTAIRETERASPFWLETRAYLLTHVLAHGMAAHAGQVKQTLVDGRPYVGFVQAMTDAFVLSLKVSDQNMAYMERTYVASLNAHRWGESRSEPAFNYLIVGASGAGKSFVLKRAEYLAPPGAMTVVSTTTPAAFNVDQDFDNTCYIYEEMDSTLLFSSPPGSKGANDTGANDKTNHFKARTTAFMTKTQYFFSDKETGARMSKTAYSSQHNSMCGATNQKLENIDPPVKRRLVIDYVVVTNNVASDGGKATDVMDFDLLARAPEAQSTQSWFRELHCALFYVETAIKAGALPDVLMDGASMLLTKIFDEAARHHNVQYTESTTRRHWVLEAARMLTILYACYMGLFSAQAHAIFEARGDALRRWSPECFHLLVAPFLFVGKEQLLHALELYDFLFASRDEDRLLRTLVLRGLHVDDARLWEYRQVAGSGGNAAIETDVNYLIMRGSSIENICERLCSLNREHAVLRVEDVRAILMAYNHTVAALPEFTLSNRGVVRTGQVRDMSVLRFEHDPRSTGKYNSQLCVALGFLERRFNIDLCAHTPAQIAARIAEPETVVQAAWFARDASPQARAQGDAAAAQLGTCSDTRSPLVAAARTVLETPTLERSAYEHATLLPLPAPVFTYATGYRPDMVKVHFGGGGGGGAQPEMVRVPLHAARLVQRLERKSEGARMHFNNYQRPSESAMRTIYNVQDMDALSEVEKAHGYAVTEYDLDVCMAIKQLDRLGHPGFPELEAHWFAGALADTFGTADVPSSVRDERAARLAALVPPMRGVAVGGGGAMRPEDEEALLEPLPFNFAPITYRIERELRAPTHKYAAYPDALIRGRIEETVTRVRKDPGTYRSYEETIGLSRRRGFRAAFDAPADATWDTLDRSVRARPAPEPTDAMDIDQ